MRQMPYEKLIRRRGKSKAKCYKCKEFFRVRHIIKYKGKFLCTNCRNKLPSFKLHYSITKGSKFNRKKTLEQALAKVYSLRGYVNKSTGNLSSQLNFPSVLVGRKVKLVLVE